jgi:molybdenum cofactor cytidylyltransferase
VKPRPLLLAGGSASRFGSQKLLADFHGAPLVAHAARRLAEGTGSMVLAVIPLGSEELREVLEPLGCEVLESDRCLLGLGGSLSAAVEASAQADGWIVALGDMPLVPVAAIRAVARSIEEGAWIAAPVHEGRRGHPVGFAHGLYAQLSALRGDEGARAVVREHAGRLVRIPCDEAGVLADVDTPGQLEALREGRP